MSLKKQLARYKKHLKRDSETVSKNEPRHPEAETEKQNQQVSKALERAAKEMDAEVKWLDESFMFYKETRFPLSASHGIYELSAIREAVDLWQDRAPGHPLASGGLEASDLLFFDTETTGLSAGSGHMIFLLGTGVIEGDTLIIKQYFLPGPGFEDAFYYHFLKDTGSLSHLVTFNGKAFDWPRVKTRVQFVREKVPRLPQYGHFDLLHASRRLWRRKLDKVSLQNVEKKMLGFVREDDIPGHMAPFLYYEFLKAPKASLLKGIIEHNLNDILSLVTLYIHLSRLLLLAPDESGAEPSELYEIGRWFWQLREDDEAERHLAFTAKEDSLFYKESAPLLASLHKRNNRLDPAIDIYQTLIGHGAADIQDYVDAAKIFEHDYKDYETAITLTKAGKKCLDNKGAKSYGTGADKAMAAMDHRLDRLYKKLGK